MVVAANRSPFESTPTSSQTLSTVNDSPAEFAKREAEREALLAQERQERIDLFNANPTGAVGELKRFIAMKKYEEAVMYANRYADAGNAEFQALVSTAEKRLSERVAAQEKQAAVALRVEAKKRGVSLGMTPEEVHASSWGKPQSINRTIGSYGTHEQWVYGGGYLYFQNGVLTTIQN